jgi:hypothetical protein
MYDSILTIYLLHVAANLVAIFREVHYKGEIQRTWKYSDVLNLKSNAFFCFDISNCSMHVNGSLKIIFVCVCMHVHILFKYYCVITHNFHILCTFTVNLASCVYTYKYKITSFFVKWHEHVIYNAFCRTRLSNAHGIFFFLHFLVLEICIYEGLWDWRTVIWSPPCQCQYNLVEVNMDTLEFRRGGEQ